VAESRLAAEGRLSIVFQQDVSYLGSKLMRNYWRLLSRTRYFQVFASALFLLGASGGHSLPEFVMGYFVGRDGGFVVIERDSSGAYVSAHYSPDVTRTQEIKGRPVVSSPDGRYALSINGNTYTKISESVSSSSAPVGGLPEGPISFEQPKLASVSTEQFAVALNSIQPDGREIWLETVGDASQEVRYRVCHFDNSGCLAAPIAPCPIQTISYKTALVMDAAPASLGILFICQIFPVGPTGGFEFWGYSPASPKWQLIEKIELPKGQARTEIANLHIGPRSDGEGGVSLVRATEAGYSVTDYTTSFSKVRQYIVSGTHLSQFPVMGPMTAQTPSDFALWLEKRKINLPASAHRISIGPAGQILFLQETSSGNLQLCVQKRDGTEACAAGEFKNSARPTLRTMQIDGKELLYYWYPRKRTTVKSRSVIFVRGGPFVSPLDLDITSVETMNDLGYDVAIPILNAGSTAYRYVPAIDGRTFDVQDAARDLDALSSQLASDDRGRLPAIVSASAGTVFAARMNRPVFGQIVLSGACFPVEVNLSGQLQLTEAYDRAQIIDDGGIAKLSQGQDESACSLLKDRRVPTYGIFYKDDPFLGPISVSKSYTFLNAWPTGKAILLPGRYHVVGGPNQPLRAQLRRAFNFIESKN
jgi:hypothetical protein